MLLRKILIVSASVALVACTGVLEPRGGGGVGIDPGQEPPPPPPPPPPGGAGASALFLDTVAPLMEAKCASCHADGGTFRPYFLTASSDGYYDKVMAGYPNPELINSTPGTSLLYTKGETPHAPTNVVWEPTELTTIGEWITAEATARAGGTPTPDPDPDDDCGGEITAGECAMEKFGRCFTPQNWTDNEMYRVANVQTDSGGCANCHFDETGGFFADGDANNMYDAWKDLPSLNKLVVATPDGTGIVQSYRIRDKGGEGGTHPVYTLDEDTELRFNAFIDATLLLYSQGPCNDQTL